jgi:hypothetical protein
MDPLGREKMRAMSVTARRPRFVFRLEPPGRPVLVPGVPGAADWSLELWVSVVQSQRFRDPRDSAAGPAAWTAQ